MNTQKLNASIFINAPKEKVWETMLDKDTYAEWTRVFNPTSRYEGDWSEGSKIIFIGTDEEGNEGGMVSRIAECRPHDYISIEHVGIIKDGVEDYTSDEVKKWVPAFENYTFTEKDGGTEVTIDQDIEEEYKEMFDDMWPKALLALKELVEKQ